MPSQHNDDARVVRFRLARPDDAGRVAALHADSWRRHYRGAYSDAFLDGEVIEERQAAWVQRLRSPTPRAFTMLAERSEALVGLAHVIRENDPIWGSQLENLHVAHDLKGQGIGGRMLEEVAAQFIAHGWPGAMYLWVLEQNAPAQAFYSSHGGRRVERITGRPVPGGGEASSFRYAWSDITEIQQRSEHR